MPQPKEEFDRRLDEKGIVATREKYRTYIADILRLGDVADAETKAQAIFKLESEIADILNLSERTVQRQWSYARAWLFDEIQRAMGAAK